MGAAVLEDLRLPGMPTGWSVEGMTLHGKRRATARRLGVTFIFVGTPRDGWEVVKLHKGRVIAEKRLRHLSKTWTAAVMGML